MTESFCQMFLSLNNNLTLNIQSPYRYISISMSNRLKNKILKLKESSTLVINEKSKKLIKQGKKVYQFGFGQSPFPVPEKIVEALKNNAHRKEYLPIQGLPNLREAISNYLNIRYINISNKYNLKTDISFNKSQYSSYVTDFITSERDNEIFSIP